MFHTKQSTSLFVMIFLVFGYLSPFVSADEIEDQTDVQERVLQLQQTDPSLPGGVDEQKGKVGTILSKLFTSSGKVQQIFLHEIFTGLTGGKIPYYDDANSKLGTSVISASSAAIGIGGGILSSFIANFTGNVNITGDLDVIGNISMTGTPTSPDHVVTKDYVDNNASGLWEEGSNDEIYYNTANVGIGDANPGEKLSVAGRISVTTDPDSGDDLMDRDYADARFINVGETISGDDITDGTIDSSEIEDNTLTASDLAANSVTASELATSSVTSTDILDSTITASDLAANSVTASELATSSVTSTDILDSTITASDLAANSVGTSEVADNTLTASDLAANSVTASELATSSVTSTDILDSTITASDLASNSVGTSELATNSVTASELAANSVAASEIAASAVGTSEVADNTLTASDLAANSVTASELATSSVTSTDILDSTITASDLAANSVTASELATSSVTSTDILDSTITASDLAANSVTASELATSSVTSTDILDSTITASDLASNSVAAAEIAAGAVGTSEVADNSLIASDLAANSVGDSELTDTPLVSTLGINAANGYGIKFWNSDTYKIHMGTGTGYGYGPVTGYSIKNDMSNTAGRGFTWGVTGLTPTVGFEAQTGDAQFAGTVAAADPTASNHVTTKSYVDSLVQGIVWQEPNQTSQTCNSSREGWATYNTTDSVIYVCNGSAWVNIGDTATIPYATTTSPGRLQLSGDIGGTWNSVQLNANSVGASEITDNSITESEISDSFVARDSSLLDGVDGASLMRTDVDDTHTNKIVVSDTDQRRAGMYGIYNSYRTGHIWSMGSAYQIPEDGSDFGNLYGFGYKHTNNATAGTMASGHQAVWAQNGTPNAALGTNIWTSGAYVSDGTTVINSAAYIVGDRIEQNSVDGSEIQDSSITASDLAANSVTASELASNSVAAAEIAAGAVGTSEVAANSLTASDLATNSVGNLELIDTPLVSTLGINAANGYGIKFWNSDTYKIHMGTGTGYAYGPVTSYSIKNDMSNTAGRGFTWGVTGLTPTVGFEAQTGDAQFAGTVTAATPTADGHLATKAYVDGAGGGAIDDLSDAIYDGSSIFLGANSGLSDDGNNENVGLGRYALQNNTSGDDNAAVGITALRANTTGTDNTAMGSDSLELNTTGSFNTGIGAGSLESNTIGSQNTALGHYALRENTTGGFNTAVGDQSLGDNTTGTQNVAVGSQSLMANTTGSQNIAIGHEALEDNTTGGYNVAVGSNSLFANTTGNGNIGVGLNALLSNTTGSQNVGVGSTALSGNTTGFANTAIGHSAIDANTTGHSNTAIGNQALENATTANQNTAIGRLSLVNTTTGYANAGLGDQSLNANTTGYYNTGVGQGALYANTTGYRNTSIGRISLEALTTGDDNIAIGYAAGSSLSTGNRNIMIGYDVDPPSNTASNQLSIGNLIYGTGLNGTDATISTGNIGIGVSTPTARLHVDGNVIAATPTLDEHLATKEYVDANGGLWKSESGKITHRGNNSDIEAYSHSSDGPKYKVDFDLLRSRGTETSPTSIISGDYIGGIRMSGYDGTDYRSTTAIYSKADGTVTGSSLPTELSIYVENEDVEVDSDIPKLTIKSTGNIGIGVSTPTAKLHVDGNVIAATPTLDEHLATKAYVDAAGGGGSGGAIDDLSDAIYDGSSIFLGANSGLSDDGGNENIGLGRYALQAITSGDDNVAIGINSQQVSTTGRDNISIGSNTLLANTTGYENTVMGISALSKNINGNRNTAIGSVALLNLTTGDFNTAVGAYANWRGTTGDRNTSIGQYSMSNATSANYNTAVGYAVMENVTTGSKNIAIGYNIDMPSATASNQLNIGNIIYGNNINGADGTISTGNIGIGVSAPTVKLHVDGNIIASTPTASSHVATKAYVDANGGGGSGGAIDDLSDAIYDGSSIFLGANSGFSDDGNNENVGIGRYALQYNTSGDDNAAFGITALRANTTGTDNTAMGSDSLELNTTGSFNTGIGAGSLESNTTGSQNTALGHYALRENTTGGFNTAVGDQSLGVNTTGIRNTAVGRNGLKSNTTGNYNIALGYEAMENVTTGSKNIAIGYDIDMPSATASNQLNIGNIIYGNDIDGAGGTLSAGNIGIGVSSPSYKLHVNGTAGKTGGGSWTNSSDMRLKNINGSYEYGLDEILSLNPVRFTYKDDNARNLPSNEGQIGFIAQEVQEVIPEAVSEGKDGYLDFNMHSINVATVNAIQEQQEQIDALVKIVEIQQKQIKLLQKEIVK